MLAPQFRCSTSIPSLSLLTQSQMLTVALVKANAYVHVRLRKWLPLRDADHIFTLAKTRISNVPLSMHEQLRKLTLVQPIANQNVLLTVRLCRYKQVLVLALE